MAVAPMRARDEVVALERLAHPHRDRFFPHVEMGQARHLGALVELVDLLLEGADLRHLPVHVQVLLDGEARVGGGSRHGILRGPGVTRETATGKDVESRPVMP
jgi:hypothetical protein